MRLQATGLRYEETKKKGAAAAAGSSYLKPVASSLFRVDKPVPGGNTTAMDQPVAYLNGQITPADQATLPIDDAGFALARP